MTNAPGPKEGPLGYTHGIIRLGEKKYLRSAKWRAST